MRRILWIIVLLLFHCSLLAASKEDDRPDKEMLGLMEFLAEMEMIRNLDLMRQMDSIERTGQPPADPSKQKNPTAKTKVQ